MKSRAVRLSLLVFFVVALGVTAYLFWKTESAERSHAAARESFEADVRSAARQVVDLRGAQQAYVATGQENPFWFSRVASILSNVRPRVDALRTAALAADARTELDAAAGSLQDFEQMDNRARDFVRRGELDRAADLIFSSGTELTENAVSGLDRAAAVEAGLRNEEAATAARRQLFALATGGGAAVLVLLLLYPTGAEDRVHVMSPAVHQSGTPRLLADRAPASHGARHEGSLGVEHEGWTSAKRASQAAAGTAPAAEPVQAPSAGVPDLPLAVPEMAEPVATYVPSPAPAAAFNFGAVASLCTELSRIDDTMALPPLLERAAHVLDAVGIILWIADPDARELTPVLAQGYPQHLVTRLGTIPRHAENATAAAFRTSLLQTVVADEVSNGAIAAPLVTCGGCVGVMAAEVRGDGARETPKLASACIIAAQLASLVGPPPARAEVRAEAAGA
jgi:CHASE3 domain sensor protein